VKNRPFSRRRREIREEIETHLEMATRDRIERGESPDQARAAALREFGNVDLVQRNTREVWSWTKLEQLVQDARFGARILWHSPGLSASAVLLVALVVGGNTTIYSVVHHLLTAPAPGVEREGLVAVGIQSPGEFLVEPYMSYANYLDYGARARSVQRTAGVSNERLTVRTDEGSYAVYGGLVTDGYFDTLGVRITLGRALREDDDRLVAGGLPAVISDRLWRDRFHRDATIIGRRITLNGNAAIVVGVAAPRFLGAHLTPGEDIWAPIVPYYDAIGSRAVLHDRAQWVVQLITQLAPGASLAQARAEFATLSAQLEAAYPVENKNRRATVTAYSSTAFLPMHQIFPRFLALFSIITAITLLVVSANVANLMLARAVARQRETAVRQSLGASRARIVRMLLAEGVAVSFVAWIAAFVMAWWTSKALVRIVEPTRQQLLPDFTFDWVVAAYAFALAMVATLAFSTAPALRTWRQQLLPWLKAGEQGASPERSRLSRALVVLQLAFSVLLLTSAALAHRSIALLDSGDLGFDKEQLVLVTVRARRTGAAIDAERSPAEREASFATLERVRERLTAVPNVTAVSYSRRWPGAYALGTVPAWRTGQPEPVQVMLRPVGPDYLQVLAVSPLVGREISAADRRGSHRIAVVNDNLATTLWPEQSALGQMLAVGRNRDAVEVVGVAPNALFDGPVRNPRPLYVLVAEQQVNGDTTIDPRFYIRYRGALESVTPSISKAIAEVDTDLPIVSIATMNSRLDEVLTIERTVSRMLVFFAVVSLLVAILGQYAMTAFNMRRRTREFGVRLALGASTRQVQRAVIYETLQTTAVGLVLGFVLSLVAGVAGRRVLFGVTPTDPPTYISVVVVLAIASVIASYLPAWRAGRVNVIEALRQE
jgi:putative ABC transport system permease protein